MSSSPSYKIDNSTGIVGSGYREAEIDGSR